MKINIQKFKSVQAALVPGLMLIGVVAILTLPSAAHRPHKASGLIVSYSSSTPDERPIEDTGYEWKGGPTDPKLIDFPTITTNGFIQKIGIDQNSQLAVPTNIHLAGWYTESARPGERGLSIIDGHVDGINVKEGVFNKLGQLKIGDIFTIMLGGGSVLTYKIVNNQTVDASVAESVLFSQRSNIKSQLNLITCTGSYDVKAKSYLKRIIVSAELL